MSVTSNDVGNLRKQPANETRPASARPRRRGLMYANPHRMELVQYTITVRMDLTGSVITVFACNDIALTGLLYEKVSGVLMISKCRLALTFGDAPVPQEGNMTVISMYCHHDPSILYHPLGTPSSKSICTPYLTLRHMIRGQKP